jgi:hypothetical protein
MRDVNLRKKLMFLTFNAGNGERNDTRWHGFVSSNAMNRIKTVNGGGAAVEVVCGAVGA